MAFKDAVESQIRKADSLGLGMLIAFLFGVVPVALALMICITLYQILKLNG